MSLTRLSRFAALVLCGGLAAYSATASAADRKPEEILKEIDAVKMPKSPVKRDQASVQAYLTERQKASEARAKLAAELYKADPKNEQLPDLLNERWQNLANNPGSGDEVKKEIDEVIATSKNEKLVGNARFMRAVMAYRQSRGDVKKALPAIEEFIKAMPKDERGASLLNAIAQRSDETMQRELFKRIARDYAGTATAARVEGKLRQAEAVGKPFDLEFKEAITGSEITMKGLKGKVVVIDFWATWCGPCVAEMPKMKTLYSEFKHQGVEFIGVSLDQPKDEGGYDKLKAFVEKEKIEWPQYYQGDGWESKFSNSWGIDAIPAVFVVDQEGNLFSVNARGKLDKMIPELLAKAKK